MLATPLRRQFSVGRLPRVHGRLVLALMCAACCSLSAPEADAAAMQVVVRPPEVHLSGNFAEAQLLVSGLTEGTEPNAKSPDLTSAATYESLDPQVVSVSASGQLLAHANGQTKVVVKANGQTVEIPVSVEQVLDEPAIGFDFHVLPILTKAGCSAGACHASQHGKGGFKLSVFGFSPEDDYAQIVRDRQGRRIDRLTPSQSLFLLKPTMAVPHGGSRRLEPDSVALRVLESWIAGGLAPPDKKSARVTRIQVEPPVRSGALGFEQQLRVVATYSDGRQRDVTSLAKFDSMDEGVSRVTSTGLITTVGRGQAPVMVRFEGQAEICMLIVPYSDQVQLTGWENNNWIDELASAKFRELGIEPSPVCDDATFLRRAFLDAVGTMPKVEETRAFLASADPHKRRLLIDQLLGLTGDPQQDRYNEEYAAWWSLKWSDLIRNTSDKLGDQGMWALHNWIKESFRRNKPFDQFVAELITARGSIYMSGPANYFRISATPQDLAESTAQTFLGVRLQCAQCHHHPFEKYGQDDYFGFAAFFSRVGSKNSQEFGLFGRESVIMVRSTGDVRQPRSGQVMVPTPLEGQPVDHPLDRRLPLASWLTDKSNPFFARNVVNRYMAYLLGRGLVDPVDDMRATNPPSNVELLQRLSQEFISSKYDLKQLIRTVMNSRLYQLDYQPTESNATDARFYSHFGVKRLSAEVLVDAIDYATGTQTKFKDLPLGTKAIELPDGQYPTYSLAVFGKPKRASTCECERSSEPSLVAALHVINSDMVSTKVMDAKGRVARLIAEKKPHDEIVDELYLSTLCRFPTAAERDFAQQTLAASASPKEAYEDLLWTLLNTKTFVFNR